MSTVPQVFQTLAARTLKAQYKFGNTKLGGLFDLPPSTLGSRIITLDKAMLAHGNDIRAYLSTFATDLKLDLNLPVPGEEAVDDSGYPVVILQQKPLKGIRTNDLGLRVIKKITAVPAATLTPAPKVNLPAVTPSTKVGTKLPERLSQPSAFEAHVQRVYKIIAEQLGISIDQIQNHSKLYDDLGADSLDTVELVMAMEDEFDIEIQDEKAESYENKTVFDIASALAAELKIDNAVVKVPSFKTVGVKAATPQPAAPKAAPAAMTVIKAILLPAVLVVVRDGTPLQIEKNHKNFADIQKILQSLKPDASGEGAAISTGDLERVYNLIDMKTGLKNWANDRVEVKNNSLYLDSKKIDGRISDRMVDAMLEGDTSLLNKLAKFLIKLDENPAFAVVTRLYDFMAARDIEIDEDGDLICWKVVQANYLDKHSGTMDNSPGKEVRIKRNQVDENADTTCSYGLHVCSKQYIREFYQTGCRIVSVKVSPADWVAIPRDYNNSKSRVCGYKVLKDVTDAALGKGWAKE